MKRHILLEIFFIVFFVVFLITALWSTGVGYNIKSYDITGAEHEIENVETEKISELTTFYYLNNVDWSRGYDAIAFYTTHQEVYIYADGVLIYSRERVNSIFGHSTGSSWNFVTIPNDASSIRVEISSVYNNITNSPVKFYQGNAVSMVLDRCRGSLLGTFLSVLIIVIGLCLIVFWVMERHLIRDMHDLVYLGMLAIFLGLWSMGEGDLAQILLQNRTMGTYIGFSCILLVAATSIMFAKTFFLTKDKWLYWILIMLVLSDGTICFFAQAFHLFDFKQAALVIQASIPLAMIYWIYAIVYTFRRGTELRKAWINVIGIGALFIAIGMDMVFYYIDRSNANQLGKIGFLIYITLLGMETARETRQMLEEKRQLSLYREMAIKDMLTGCFNRNAYDSDVRDMKECIDRAIVTCDLNNLKACNDTLGHQMGDKYLMDSAKVLNSVFSKFGKVYRIGGDEFAVIMQNLPEQVMNDLIHKVEDLFDFQPVGEKKLELGCACGYAGFDPSVDKNLEDTRARADVKMYIHKKELKGTVTRE